MSKIIVHKVFDEWCFAWRNDLFRNIHYLRNAHSYLYEKCKVQGYLFLNDAYEMLGMPKTKSGQFGGWIFDREVIFWTIDPTFNPTCSRILLTFEFDDDILNSLPKNEEET